MSSFPLVVYVSSSMRPYGQKLSWLDHLSDVRICSRFGINATFVLKNQLNSGKTFHMAKYGFGISDVCQSSRRRLGRLRGGQRVKSADLIRRRRKQQIMRIVILITSLWLKSDTGTLRPGLPDISSTFLSEKNDLICKILKKKILYTSNISNKTVIRDDSKN